MSKVYTDSLTHYGVKGMHWGVRKADGSWSTKSKQKAERTPEQARAAKIERNARIGILIAGGAAFVASQLVARGKIKIGSIDFMKLDYSDENFSDMFEDGGPVIWRRD